MSQTEKIVKIEPLKKEQIQLLVKGVTPLLMEQRSQSVVDAIENKKNQKVIEKDRRCEEEKVEEKIYKTEDGAIGFPAAGFAKGMVEVAPYFDGLDKKRVRGSIRVLGNIIPIAFKEQTINKSSGTSGGIAKAPRRILRPEFKEWSCKIDILYNSAQISAEQIVNLLNYAGFHMGIGGWRPSCNGSYGQYEVVSSEQND